MLDWLVASAALSGAKYLTTTRGAMYSTIKIECIGPVQDPALAIYDSMFDLGYKKCFKKRWWVARIVGLDKKYGFKRDFLSPKNDFAKSNSKGSRGIFANYFLEHGYLYEISAPTSWRATDRYFYLPDKNRRLSNQEAVTWLKSK